MNKSKVQPFSGSKSSDAFQPLRGIVQQKNVGIGQLSAQKGLESKHSQVQKAFVSTCIMGMLVPSLHRESTDSLIYSYWSHERQCDHTRINSKSNCVCFGMHEYKHYMKDVMESAFQLALMCEVCRHKHTCMLYIYKCLQFGTSIRQSSI